MIVFNTYCFNCHYSTEDGRCKCGLNQDIGWHKKKIDELLERETCCYLPQLEEQAEKIDELENYKRMWQEIGGGANLRHLKVRCESAEAKLAKAVEQLKLIQLAVEEADTYIQIGKKLEEIVEHQEFKQSLPDD